MRITCSLLSQHLGWHFKRKWKQLSSRIIRTTEAEEILKSHGKTVHNPDDILYENPEFIRLDFVKKLGEKVPWDTNHPLYKQKPSLTLRDHNVLIEGLDQAKILTKTVEIEDGLPSLIENFHLKEKSQLQDKLVQRYILSSHMFDATQEKLPRLHDPARPAWNFPRVYGISHYRRARLIACRLLQLCEMMVGGEVPRASTVEDGKVVVMVQKDNDLLQFDFTIDLAHIFSKPLPSLAVAEDTLQVSLPDIYPLSSTVTLEQEHFYRNEDGIFISGTGHHQYINTVIIYFDETKVNNLHDTPVNENQILGRTLLKCFAVAAAQAKQKFGAEVQTLPQPVTVQCVHTDGRLFHFTVFQLNTLDLSGTEGIKNIIWTVPRMPLFNSCSYISGRPNLEGYNPDVLKTFLAFYKHSLQL